MKRTLLALGVALAATCSAASEVAPAPACTPTLEGGWIRAAPPGAMMLAGYGRLHNGCDREMVLVAVHSDRFALAETHRTVLVDGVSRMRAEPRVVVAAGASAMLAPGGLHLMLMRPGTPVREGEAVTASLRFEDGSRVDAVLVVRREPPPAG